MSDCDSFDEDNDDYGLLKKALDVKLPDDFDPNKIPQTGEEYLQHVMYERTKCKTWITANIDRNKFKNKQTFKIETDNVCLQAPEAILPTPDWQKMKVDEFTDFRNFIKFQTKNEPNISSFDEDRFIEKIELETPQLSESVKYTQSANIRMLQLISKCLDSIQPGASINKNLGSWVYSILTLLEKPLSPSSCHTLREFAKKCRLIRSNLPENANEQLYTPLNLFICLIAKCYDQLDLSDL